MFLLVLLIQTINVMNVAILQNHISVNIRIADLLVSVNSCLYL